MDKSTISGKKKARRLALQAIYQWLMSGSDTYEIEAQFRAINNMKKVDVSYFSRLVQSIPKERNNLEIQFSPYLDRDIKELNPIECSILLIGAYELIHCLDIPFKVVLDESISMAKEFGSQDGHKYVNGVLNNLAQKVRTIEINSQ